MKQGVFKKNSRKGVEIFGVWYFFLKNPYQIEKNSHKEGGVWPLKPSPEFAPDLRVIWKRKCRYFLYFENLNFSASIDAKFFASVLFIFRILLNWMFYMTFIAIRYYIYIYTFLGISLDKECRYCYFRVFPGNFILYLLNLAKSLSNFFSFA